MHHFFLDLKHSYQKRRQLIKVEEDFDNSIFKLELAKAYDKSVLINKTIEKDTILDAVVKETEEYQGAKLTKEDLGNIIW